MRTLFVCTGNTCRSPMAEAICNAIYGGASSAGLSVAYPSPPTQNAVMAMSDMGLDIRNHISRRVNRELIDESDVILTMTKSHKNALLTTFPEYGQKIFTLAEKAGESGDIDDPFGTDAYVYRACADQLYDYIKKIYKIEVVKAAPSDADSIIALENEEHFISWTDEMFSEELSNDAKHYFLLKLDGHLIGYAGFLQVIDEAHVMNIGVAAAHRRRGGAKMLLDAMLEECKELGVKEMLLEVRSGNMPARRLYEKFGFYISGSRKGYYDNGGEDAVLMAKNL